MTDSKVFLQNVTSGEAGVRIEARPDRGRCLVASKQLEVIIMIGMMIVLMINDVTDYSLFTVMITSFGCMYLFYLLKAG